MNGHRWEKGDQAAAPQELGPDRTQVVQVQVRRESLGTRICLQRGPKHPDKATEHIE